MQERPDADQPGHAITAPPGKTKPRNANKRQTKGRLPVSKRETALTIERVADLEGKDIVAFNGASLHLKEPFTTFHAGNLKDSANYREIENQRAQYSMLQSDRAQVILLDRYMVQHYAKEMGHDLSALVFHEIFPHKNAIYAVAKRRAVLDAVTRHIDEMRASGWVDEMLSKYR